MTRTDDLEAEAAALADAARTSHLHGEVHVKIGAATVTLTHLDRVYWPEDGCTKGDLVSYYHGMADHVLPHVKDRPLILRRYPRGIGRGSFHQHEAGQVPSFVRTVRVESEAGRTIDYVVCDNTATLLYLANLGAIALHPWHSRRTTLDAPDWIVFDLDPEQTDYAVVCKVALALKEVLDRIGLASYPKTSGASGMHVYVPIDSRYTYDQAAQVAELAAFVAARENPDLVTLERSLAKRRAGRVYLDHLQNARGKSVVAPYSVRARLHVPVSTPLDWAEVRRGIIPTAFTIRTIARRLATKGDLFEPVLSKRQSLEPALVELRKLTGNRKGKSPGS